MWESVRCAAASHLPDGAPATRVVLVRHGETDWNAGGIYQGWQDVPLNENGREQARFLAQQLAGVLIDAAYSSPLLRATETAETILGANACEMSARPVTALRELSYGEWEGIPPQERRARWALLDDQWATDPWSVQFPGGESLDLLAARALPVWEGLLAQHAGQTILLAGHGHLNRVILLHARSVPRDSFWDIAQPNGSATMLECLPISPLAGVAR